MCPAGSSGFAGRVRTLPGKGIDNIPAPAPGESDNGGRILGNGIIRLAEHAPGMQLPPPVDVPDFRTLQLERE